MNPAFAQALAPAYNALADAMQHTEALTGITTPVRGLFSATDNTLFGEAVISARYAVRYRVSGWPPVVRGDGVTVDGIDYVVREEPRLLLDGLEAIIPLERAQ